MLSSLASAVADSLQHWLDTVTGCPQAVSSGGTFPFSECWVSTFSGNLCRCCVPPGARVRRPDGDLLVFLTRSVGVYGTCFCFKAENFKRKSAPSLRNHHQHLSKARPPFLCQAAATVEKHPVWSYKLGSQRTRAWEPLPGWLSPDWKPLTSSR